MDLRIKQLAYNLVNYSCDVKKNEKVYIEYTGKSSEILVIQLIKEIYKVGGLPFIYNTNSRIHRQILLNCTEEQINLMAKFDSDILSIMDCYIGIRGTDNLAEFADVSIEKRNLYSKLYTKPIQEDIILSNTKWCIIRYPNNAMAQLYNMSYEAFENYYFDACCNVDYLKMNKAMQPLVKLMNSTDKVRIKGLGTDLTFSIKGIPVVVDCGRNGFPDGEVFTSPIKDSINGIISYNAPSIFQSFTYSDIVFKFKDGKIIDAKANNTERINKILDVDDGARFIGEFAIGVNPYIVNPVGDSLFDEKISGSFHFTPGNCYETASNGNASSIHWDLVCIQTPEYGGGEIYFDDILVRKAGRFVLPELYGLNPENLK